MNIGGAPAVNHPNNLFVTVLTKEVVSLPRKSLLRKPRKWPFAIANIPIMDLFATGHIVNSHKSQSETDLLFSAALSPNAQI